jgi:hypothetical protein
MRVILNSLRFVKMCLCQVSFLSRRSPRYLTPSACTSWTLFMWMGGNVSLRVVNVTWVYLKSLALTLHFMSQICIARRLNCNLLETVVVRLLSMARTAVSSGKVADVVSYEAGRSAVISKYSSGPRTLPWGTPAWMGKSSVYSFSILTRKYLMMK